MRTSLITFLLIAVAGVAQAAGPTVENAWIRYVPGQTNAAGYLSLTSPMNDTITGVKSSCCTAVELHKMTMDGNRMHMERVDEVALPVGKVITFGPMGYHVMLIGLKKSPAVGDTIPLTFTLKSGGTVDVALIVKPINASPAIHH